MTPFVIKISMATPVIPGRRLLLDGLLAALIYERTGSVERAHAEIPLDRSSGVWAGSQAFIDGNSPLRGVMIVGSIRADMEITPDMIRPNGGRKALPRIDSARGDYQNSLSEYTSINADAVWFCGTGDVAAVKDLLSDASGIGTKRSVGYGQVSRIDVREVTGHHVGLALADGSPARPVPVSIWGKLSNQRAALNAERFQPPYWQGDYALCAVPNPVGDAVISPRFLAA